MDILYGIKTLILDNPCAITTFKTYFEDGVKWKRGQADISAEISEEQLMMALCMTLAAFDDRLPVKDRLVTEDIAFDFEDYDWALREVWVAAGGYVME